MCYGCGAREHVVREEALVDVLVLVGVTGHTHDPTTASFQRVVKMQGRVPDPGKGGNRRLEQGSTSHRLGGDFHRSPKFLDQTTGIECGNTLWQLAQLAILSGGGLALLFELLDGEFE